MLFAIPAMTLAGLPPTAGFVAKLQLLQAGAEAGVGPTAVAAVVIVASFLTLYALVRVWVRVFWGMPAPTVEDPDRTTSWRSAPLARRGPCTPPRPGWWS